MELLFPFPAGEARGTGAPSPKGAAPTKADPAHTDYAVLGSSGEIGHSGLSRDQILFSWLILCLQ